MKRFFKKYAALLPALALPSVIFAFTLGRCYGFYYDNHYMNLLALDMMEHFRPYLYLGSHYSIHSALFSYIVYPLFYIFGPTDFSMELAAALFHLATIVVCFKLGEKFVSRALGLVFAYIVSVAPICLLNIYTWPEYGLIGFLNILSVYYFCGAISGSSSKLAVLAAVLFSLSCLQAIYSLLLLPFFVMFWLLYMVIASPRLTLSGAKQSQKGGIAQPVASPLKLRLLRRSLRSLLAMTSSVRRAKQSHKSLLAMTTRSGLLFFTIVTVMLIAAEIFVQLDMNFFGQYFGYYRDTTFAGGFGTVRPPFYWAGKPVVLFGIPVYSSVLTSIATFSSTYSKVAVDIFTSFKVMLSYYRQCHPFFINLFFGIGVIGVIFEVVRKSLAKKAGPDIGEILALSWFIAACASFGNVYPYHMLRIYIMPMPYFLAAFGVLYIGRLAAFLARRDSPGTAVIVGLTVFLLYAETRFSYSGIFNKYKYDKANAMYYKLYHGWPYGRSYREVGEFLLKEAPLKKNGVHRSAFIYTVSPYSGQKAKEICAVFYNSIDWYTQNKINIIYDDIHTSYNKYGTAERLRVYLYHLFFRYPELEAVYFADFRDKGDNYAFFSKLYPDIKPYAIVNDDNRTDYDCVLYKFNRNDWQKYWGRFSAKES